MFSVTETPKHGKTHTIFFTKHTCTIQYSYDFIYTYSILVSPIPKHELFFLFISLHILGIYVCAKCDHPLFSSVSKYEHQTPWPAFTNPLRNDSLSKNQKQILKTVLSVMLWRFLIFLNIFEIILSIVMDFGTWKW